ncbi:MAG: hypothetical protein ACE5LF_03870 [Alphaproteobacteria bacterium]
MLTLEDCIGLSDLTREEIEAIAAHEHLPEIVALELGNCLLRSPEGVALIRRMIADEIRGAELHGDRERALRLKAVLEHFTETHPEARRRRRTASRSAAKYG